MIKNFFTSERNMLIAIGLNAFIIFLISFPDLRANEFLHNIDYFFIIFFLIEAMVKMSAYGSKAYFKDGWNVFDFILVVVSLPALLQPFFEVPNTSLILLFRLIRLLRMLRIIRVLSFIPRVHEIVEGLGRALKASVFVFILLFFFAFLLALFSCQLYGGIAPEYFGDPFVSLFTIFQLFTIEGWNEIPSTIVNNSDNGWLSGAARIYFLFIVLTGGILGMSLANAVFVDEMTMDNNAELETKVENLTKQIEELKDIIKSKN